MSMSVQASGLQIDEICQAKHKDLFFNKGLNQNCYVKPILLTKVGFCYFRVQGPTFLSYIYILMHIGCQLSSSSQWTRV